MRKIFFFILLLAFSLTNNVKCLDSKPSILKHANLLISSIEPVVRAILIFGLEKKYSNYENAPEKVVDLFKELLKKYNYERLPLIFKVGKLPNNVYFKCVNNIIILNQGELEYVIETIKSNDSFKIMNLERALIHEIKHTLSDGYKTIIPAVIFSIITYFTFNKLPATKKLYSIKFLMHVLYAYSYIVFIETRADRYSYEKLIASKQNIQKYIKFLEDYCFYSDSLLGRIWLRLNGNKYIPNQDAIKILQAKLLET